MKKLTHEEISNNRSTLETIHLVKKLPVFPLLYSIRSSYNVGSMFRTSDGAMVEKLYLCGYTPHPPKKEVLKTALGSQDSVDWEYIKDPVELIKELKNKGVKIASLEQTDSSVPHYSLSRDVFPLCLLIGNEISGVPQELIDQSDFSIEIPQYGIKQSLNVAVAYGVTLFELRRVFDTT